VPGPCTGRNIQELAEFNPESDAWDGWEVTRDGVIGHAMKRIPEEERKQWLLEAYRAGLVSEDEVSMFFYVFDLKEA
jgi:hypothetical protein